MNCECHPLYFIVQTQEVVLKKYQEMDENNPFGDYIQGLARSICQEFGHLDQADFDFKMLEAVLVAEGEKLEQNRNLDEFGNLLCKSKKGNSRKSCNNWNKIIKPPKNR